MTLRLARLPKPFQGLSAPQESSHCGASKMHSAVTLTKCAARLFLSVSMHSMAGRTSHFCMLKECVAGEAGGGGGGEFEIIRGPVQGKVQEANQCCMQEMGEKAGEYGGLGGGEGGGEFVS